MWRVRSVQIELLASLGVIVSLCVDSEGCMHVQFGSIFESRFSTYPKSLPMFVLLLIYGKGSSTQGHGRVSDNLTPTKLSEIDFPSSQEHLFSG